MLQQDKQLRIPGPSPIPGRVQQALSRPMIGHRSGDFKALYATVETSLKQLFVTENDVFVLTGSGTSAMEAAVANLVSPGDTVVCLVGGKFGERWSELCSAYGAKVVTYEFSYGTAADPEELKRLLQLHPDTVAVFTTQNESSTAVLNDIEGVAGVCSETAAVLVVDAVSGLGGAPLPMDRWKVDVVVTGSQKCLMLPPGLAFIAVGPKAWEKINAATSPRYYLDLRKYRKQGAKSQTPYTPAVSMVFGLEESLRMILEEGLEAGFARHRLMRDMVRNGAEALGLSLFVQEAWASPTVTAIVGEGFDVEALRKVLSEDYRILVAGGQGDLKGKIFRIGHMGYATPTDMLTTLAVLEMALLDVGHRVQLGAGVRAAEEVWRAWR